MAIKFWRFSVLGIGVWGEPSFVVRRPSVDSGYVCGSLKKFSTPWKQSALVGHDKHMPSMLQVNQSPLFPTGACKICGGLLQSALCNRRSVLREKVMLREKAGAAREGQCCERRSVLRTIVCTALLSIRFARTPPAACDRNALSAL